MSHLLSTVNPAAAAAIRPAAEALPLPPIGSTVVYTMRAGHGRMGRNRFPAIVQDHTERGTLSLTVIIDASDLSDEILVEREAVGRETHCWQLVEANFTVSAAPAETGELQALRDQVAELRNVILGDYETPSISLIDILQDFENRLKAKPKAAKRGRPAKKK